MADNNVHPERIWENGWDGHEKAQLKRMAKLSFREKIKWLEEAQEMLLNAEPLKRESDSRESVSP